MRKLIVSNMVSVDGFYEGKNRSLGDLFEHFHPDYANDDRYDTVNAERMRAADYLIYSGRDGFLGSRDYWMALANDPNATPIRHELAQLMASLEKIVVSDRLTEDELGSWSNTRIVKRADARRELAALKQQDGKDLLILMGRTLWNDLIAHGLVDELHIAYFPLIGAAGTLLFSGERPPMSLKLLGARTWDGSGIVVAQYRVDPVTP